MTTEGGVFPRVSVARRGSSFPFRFYLIAALIAAVVGLHAASFASMVNSWLANTTYNHGFAIPLIAAFFAWQRRDEALTTQAYVWWPALIVLAGLSGVWAVSMLINVQVVAQFATVLMISGVVLMMAGTRQALLFGLPLLYLVFMVPFGQGVVPLLMEWTADFTVLALHVIGIPVVRDGLYFSTSTGDFEVAEACSGVRYLLASAAAGVAFAFLTYNGWRKRMLFILASVAVPIVANGLRAFGIVVIAHYSDMKLATGIDHFIYGWVFFGVIILLLFLIGARFADHQGGLGVATQSSIETATNEGRAATAMGAAATFVVLLIGPALVGYRTHTAPEPEPGIPSVSVLGEAWSRSRVSESAWQLAYKGPDEVVSASYEYGEQSIEVRIAAYGAQEQGAELVNAINQLAGDDWRTSNRSVVDTGSEAIPRARAVRISRGSVDYLVWYWYQQGTETTTSDYEAKWREVRAVLSPSAAMVVAIAADGTDDTAQERLSGFLQLAGEALRSCAAGEGSDTRCVAPDNDSRSGD
jgi:exosortase A